MCVPLRIKESLVELPNLPLEDFASVWSFIERAHLLVVLLACQIWPRFVRVKMPKKKNQNWTRRPTSLPLVDDGFDLASQTIISRSHGPRRSHGACHCQSYGSRSIFLLNSSKWIWDRFTGNWHFNMMETTFWSHKPGPWGFGVCFSV